MCVCFRDVSLSGRKPPVWSQTSSVFLQSRKPHSGTGEKAQHSATYVHTQTHTAHTRIMFTALIWHYNAAVCVCAGAAAAPEQLSLSPCATPSSEESEVTPGSRQNMVMTPNTPELYAALKLPYYRSNICHCTSCTIRFRAQVDLSVIFCFRSEWISQSPDERNTDWPF